MSPIPKIENKGELHNHISFQLERVENLDVKNFFIKFSFTNLGKISGRPLSEPDLWMLSVKNKIANFWTFVDQFSIRCNNNISSCN